MTKKPCLLGSSLFLGIFVTLVLSLLVVFFASAKDIAPSAPVTLPTKPPIVFGSSTAMTGSTRLLGSLMTQGEQIYIDQMNASGGINNRKIELIVYDDGYDPLETAVNMRKLIADKNILGIIGNVGTPNAVLSVPIVTELQTLFYGAFTGAMVLRKTPPDRYVFSFRASFEDELHAMIDGLLKVGIKPSEVAFFTQNDSFGDAGYFSAIKALEDLGYADAKKLPHVRFARNTLNVEEGLSEILDLATAPKTIILIAPYMAAAKIIKLTLKELPQTIFFAVGFAGSSAMAEQLKEVGDRQVVVTQVVPYYKSNLPAVVEYREALKKFSPKLPLGFISLEGYLSTKLLMIGVERAAKANKLTREGLIDALETLQNIDIGIGLPISFSKTDHQALHTVWPTLLKDGAFVPFDWSELHVPQKKQ